MTLGGDFMCIAWRSRLIVPAVNKLACLLVSARAATRDDFEGVNHLIECANAHHVNFFLQFAIFIG